jgi:hypothetical protein
LTPETTKAEETPAEGSYYANYIDSTSCSASVTKTDIHISCNDPMSNPYLNLSLSRDKKIIKILGLNGESDRTLTCDLSPDSDFLKTRDDIVSRLGELMMGAGGYMTGDEPKELSQAQKDLLKELAAITCP